MAQERFSPLLRELASCFQAYELLSGRHIRSMGITPSQFDIIATLGVTDEMSCGELGDRTLITKGTLTGVLDRLERKRLIQRTESKEDRRSIIVQLTPAGASLFNTLYSKHLDYLRPAFAGMDNDEIKEFTTRLEALRSTLQQYETNCQRQQQKPPPPELTPLSPR